MGGYQKSLRLDEPASADYGRARRALRRIYSRCQLGLVSVARITRETDPGEAFDTGSAGQGFRDR
jgi:hypothetical protein